MRKNNNKLSRSQTVAAKTVYAALVALKEHGGELSSSNVMKEVEKKVEFDEWELQRYQKTGYIRWQSILHFFSIDCIKAGFLIKKKGIWFLTPEGDAALSLSAIDLLNAAKEAYKKWKDKAQLELKDDSTEDFIEENNSRRREITLNEIEEIAIEGLKGHINAKNPYEFQALAAALLRGMGYYTPFIAPKGKDGGIDIVAYRDPLGTTAPRIKIQIKHRETSTSVQEIRQLLGILSKDGDVGLFISTGGFTSDAKITARNSHIHIELIDLERFILLWQDFYQKLSDEDKSLLPLQPIYFLAPST